MPFIPNTPEALVSRSDSKNPATTCAGLAGSGRKCRRPISATLCEKGNEALYCWQHKEQAGHVPSPARSKERVLGLQTRTSIDTLAERLGLLDIESGKKKGRKKTNERVEEKVRIQAEDRRRYSTAQRPSSRSRSSSSFLGSLFCCFTASTDDEPPPRPFKPQFHHPTSSPPSRPSRHSSPTPLIPSTASPTLRARLQTELSKPISPSDTAGYIYMFWLTPTTVPRPAQRVATDLLSSTPTPTTRNLSTFISQPHTAHRKTLMLKIGRANNVTRRMQEWKRQCGYDLTLLRYYPYLDETVLSFINTTSGQETERKALKTPCTHKVERLIHIELEAMRVEGGKCEACGREHKEWFEVGADRNAVRVVDGIIRKWIDWSLGKDTVHEGCG